MSRSTRWRSVAFTIVGIVALAAGILAWSPWNHQGATPILPEAIPARILHETNSPAPAAARADPAGTTTSTTPQQPGPKVFTYDTHGGESIDALGGASRVYPSLTSMVVVESDCGGESVRWLAAEERTEERRTCEGSPAWRGLKVRNEWFGTVNERDFDCDLLDETSARCAMVGGSNTDGAVLQLTWTPDGVEDVIVEGVPVPGSRLKIEGEFSGGTTGSFTIVQTRSQDGVLLAETKRAKSETDSLVGTVTYEESYSLTLTSLEPMSVTDPPSPPR